MDTFVAARQKHPFQKASSLIVEEIFVPPVFHQLWNDDNNIAPRILLRKIEDELHHWNDDEAIRRRQNVKLRRLSAFCAERLHHVLLPIVFEKFRMLAGLDVQRDHGGRKASRKFDSLSRNVAPSVDGDDCNGMLVKAGRVHRNLASSQDFYGVVMPPHNREENNR